VSRLAETHSYERSVRNAPDWYKRRECAQQVPIGTNRCTECHAPRPSEGPRRTQARTHGRLKSSGLCADDDTTDGRQTMAGYEHKTFYSDVVIITITIIHTHTHTYTINTNGDNNKLQQSVQTSHAVRSLVTAASEAAFTS